MVARLVWSDTILDDARRLQQRVERELASARIAGDLSVTGPASWPRVLTKGDLDLHLRVSADHFEVSVGRLRAVYPATSLNAWADTLAVFEVPAVRPAGLAVTPLGSEHDRRFTSAWRRLRAEPDLLRAYNALKSRYFGTPQYEATKSAFFDEITDS